MTDDTQAKLEKLARIEEKARARSRRYLERAKEQGKRQLSAIISGDAYDVLCRIRDAAQLEGKPTSFGEIIEQALTRYAAGSIVQSDEKINVNGDVTIKKDHYIKTNVNSDVKPIKKTHTEIPGPMPDMPDRSDKKAYKLALFKQIKEMKESGMFHPDIAETFNKHRITTVSGTKWSRRNVGKFFDENKDKMENE